jgi:hypothetical protein
MGTFDVLVVYFLFLGLVELFNPPVSKKMLCFFSLMPCFFVTAFRDLSVGCDTVAYLRMFNRVAFSNGLLEAILNSRMEIGYVILNYFISHIGLSFFYLQFFIALFFYSVLFVFLSKYSKNIGLSCFLFLSLRYMFGPMNVSRMYLAVAVLIFSIQFVKQSRLLAFVICVFVASLFHNTSFAFLLLYPLSKGNLSKKQIFVVILLGAIFGLLGKEFMLFLTTIFGLYNNYLDSQYLNLEGNVAVYITLAIDTCFVLFILYNRMQMRLNEKINSSIAVTPYVSIEKICGVSVLLTIFFDLIGLSNALMSRITGYFSFCWLILIPLTIMRIRNKSAAVVMYIVLVAYLFAQYKTVMILRPNWNCVEPYFTYLEDLF